VPDKPLWRDRLPEAIRQLEQRPDPWIDRPALESLLGVGRRRAQQLLAPIAARRIGTSVVAGRTELIAHLRTIAAGEEAYYEDRRRRRLWTQLEQARREWSAQPPVLVEVPNAQIRRVESRDFDGLPEGVDLAPGSITLRFREPEEALQELLALAMAISRNRQAFDERVALTVSNSIDP
jgi:hypothetical protein